MLGGSKQAMACHFSAGPARARAGRALRRSAVVGWRLGIGFGCMGEEIETLRGIVRRLKLRRVSCRIVGEWAAW